MSNTFITYLMHAVIAAYLIFMNTLLPMPLLVLIILMALLQLFSLRLLLNHIDDNTEYKPRPRYLQKQNIKLTTTIEADRVSLELYGKCIDELNHLQMSVVLDTLAMRISINKDIGEIKSAKMQRIIQYMRGSYGRDDE